MLGLYQGALKNTLKLAGIWRTATRMQSYLSRIKGRLFFTALKKKKGHSGDKILLWSWTFKKLRKINKTENENSFVALLLRPLQMRSSEM